jgi:hypothetical protein
LRIFSPTTRLRLGIFLSMSCWTEGNVLSIPS